MNNTNDNFFPTEDYKIPETSNFLKLTEGEHTFRALSSAIVGYEYFTNENKPVRSREPFEETPTDVKKGGRVTHFWAFIVWNYEAKRLQILEITQKTIQGAIQALVRNPKWGNPKNYDLTITRKGTGQMDTEYSVMPNPHSEVAPEIMEKYRNAKINLEALFEILDPFSVDA